MYFSHNFSGMEYPVLYLICVYTVDLIHLTYVFYRCLISKGV